MDESGRGEKPTDPAEYEALLKRWGLDDDSIGLSDLRSGDAQTPDLPADDPQPPAGSDASTDAAAGAADPALDDQTLIDEQPPLADEAAPEPGADPPVETDPQAAATPADQPPIAEDCEPEGTAEASATEVGENLGLGFFAEDAPPAVESRQERRRRRVWLSRSLLALAVVIALILGTAGFYVVVGLQALQGIKRDPGLLPTDDGYQTVPAVVDGPINFVLMGSDSRSQNDPGRSDSLMVAHLNASRDTLYLISFPRDMYVDIPNHGKNKINAAYAFGGPALTVKTLQNLTGTRMDHTIMVDFDGFIGLTTDIGGVTVFNEIPSTNLGFTYPRGDITLSGEQALAYVRQRYNLPRGDFDRAARQRAVVKAIILKLLKPEIMANPATFNAVASKLGRDLTVDDKLTNQLIWSLATDLSIKSARDIKQLQAPIARDDRINGSSVQIVDPTRMAALATALQTDQLAAYWTQYGEE
jgi:polyisoprenyl-teichoic acid--peptidoglycan teichoic acid transferase